MTQPEPIYTEADVPVYTLPDPLTLNNGSSVTNAATWTTQRRPEILALFEEYVYGKLPPAVPPAPSRHIEATATASVFGGLGLRKEVTIRFSDQAGGPSMTILIYIPTATPKPIPIFLGLNFSGNHSIQPDPDITLSPVWMRENDEQGIVNNQATEASRSVSASRWPVERILQRGYGLATIYCGDLDPDFDDGFQNGIHGLFSVPKPDEWGSIGAWAWGLMRAVDYFEADDAIDHQRVIVMGHSRLGKTALWAGAYDQRFAMVISNNSGCGGAALSRRRFGETVRAINTTFPHWFCKNFHQYNGNEDTLPIDQHMLLALIAPRPLYVASAIEDSWADPRGEFLSIQAADPVYRLLDTAGLPAIHMPDVDQPIMGTLGYHIRQGGHDVTAYDWERFMDFADMHLG